MTRGKTVVFSISYVASKFIIITVITVVIGLIFHKSQVSDYNNAQKELKTLTRRSYINNYEKHKSNLMNTSLQSFEFNWFIITLMGFGFIAIYEIPSLILGFIISFIVKKSP